MSRPFISIGSPVYDGSRISFTVQCSPDVGRFLRRTTLWYEIDSLPDPGSLPSGVLAIPAVGNLVTIAWATGAALEADALDSDFVAALHRIAKTVADLYPAFPVASSDLHVRQDQGIRPTRSEEKARTGLLFSGGLDSAASLLAHHAEVTDLFTIWGADVKTDDDDLWNEWLMPLVLHHPAASNAHKHVVKTNMKEDIDQLRLGRVFGRHLTNESWWGGLQHGIGLLSLTAPAAVYHGIQHMLIASTHSEAFSLPWGSMPAIDRDMRWTGTDVVHDNYDLTRQQKIDRVIAPYVREHGAIEIAACYMPGRGGDTINCGHCEKCVRTAAGLLLAGIDPNDCGFRLTGASFDSALTRFQSHKFPIGEDEGFMWSDIKAHIPKKPEDVPDQYGSRRFFLWLRDADIQEIVAKSSLPWRSGKKIDPKYVATRIGRLLPFGVQRQIHRVRARVAR